MSSDSTISTSPMVPPKGFGLLRLFNLVFSSVGVALSVVIVLATMIPLLGRPKQRTSYSTYNLYLGLMAIPDLIANACIVYLLLLTSHPGISDVDDARQPPQWMFDHPLDHQILEACITGSLYVNTFLLFELYRLLKSSNQRKRHPPPTIAWILRQGLLSFGLGIGIAVLDVWLSLEQLPSRNTKILYQIFTVIYIGLVPLSGLSYVCYQIYADGLINESTMGAYQGRLRVLTMYILRIVVTGLVFWVPCSCLYVISWRLEDPNTTAGFDASTKVLSYHIALVFSGCQPIPSFAFALTKGDVRKLVWDLVTCRLYVGGCRNDRRYCDGGGSIEVPEGNSSYEGVHTSGHCHICDDDPFLRASLRLSSLFSSGSSRRSTRCSHRGDIHPPLAPSEQGGPIHTAVSETKTSKTIATIVEDKDVSRDGDDDDDNDDDDDAGASFLDKSHVLPTEP